MIVSITVAIGGLWIIAGLVHFLFRPRYYFVCANEVIIQQLIKKVSIPYPEIKAVKIIESATIWWVWGVFSSFEAGNKPVYAYYVNHYNNLVLLETSKRKYYLSPLKPREMLDAIQVHAG